MRDDQEWCLECGAARRVIHEPPDWRVPLLIIGGVVLLALAAFAIALINLSAHADRVAASAVPATTSAAIKPGPAIKPEPAIKPGSAIKPPTPRHAQPLAQIGWTVVLASKARLVKAQAVATRLKSAGFTAGVIYSSHYPALQPGRWIVFSGRYATQGAAAQHALALTGKGYKNGRVRLISKPLR